MLGSALGPLGAMRVIQSMMWASHPYQLVLTSCIWLIGAMMVSHQPRMESTQCETINQQPQPPQGYSQYYGLWGCLRLIRCVGWDLRPYPLVPTPSGIVYIMCLTVVSTGSHPFHSTCGYKYKIVQAWSGIDSMGPFPSRSFRCEMCVMGHTLTSMYARSCGAVSHYPA